MAVLGGRYYDVAFTSLCAWPILYKRQTRLPSPVPHPRTHLSLRPFAQKYLPLKCQKEQSSQATASALMRPGMSGLVFFLSVSSLPTHILHLLTDVLLL